MNWPALSFQAALLRLDLDIAEISDLELQTRATDAEGRAEGALTRLLAMASAR